MMGVAYCTPAMVTSSACWPIQAGGRAGWAGANLVPLQRDWPAGGRAELRPRD